jgi:hypothetical protein
MNHDEMICPKNILLCLKQVGLQVHALLEAVVEDGIKGKMGDWGATHLGTALKRTLFISLAQGTAKARIIRVAI